LVRTRGRTDEIKAHNREQEPRERTTIKKFPQGGSQKEAAMQRRKEQRGERRPKNANLDEKTQKGKRER